MKFRDLKISAKIYTIVVLILFVATAVGVIGFIGMKSSNDALKSMYEDRVVCLKQLKTVSDMYAVNIVDTSHKVRSGVLTGAQGLKNFETAENEIKKQWKDYTSTFLIAEEKKLIAEIEPLMKKSDSAVAKIKEIINRKDKKALDSFVENELYPAVDPVGERIHDLVDVQLKASKELYDKDVRQYRSILLIFVAVVGAGSIFAFAATFIISRKITRPLLAIVGNAEEVSKGNLSLEEVKMNSADEVGMLAISFNRMTANLRDFVDKVSKSSDQLSASSVELSSTADTFSKTSQGQAASTEEITATIEEVSGGVESIANDVNTQFERIKEEQASVLSLNEDILEMSSRVEKASSVTDQIADLTNSGEASLKSMSENMEKINSSSQEMKNIIGIINDISDKINLLSLNAAIEAARAGDAGRGFAVVADEISKLADQTATSIKEIGSKINENESETLKFSENVREVLSILNSIIDGVSSVRTTTDAVAETMRGGLDKNRLVINGFMELKKRAENINIAITEQKTAMDEMVRSVAEITTSAQTTAAASEEIASSSEELSGMADILKGEVNFFKT